MKHAPTANLYMHARHTHNTIRCYDIAGVNSAVSRRLLPNYEIG